MTSSTIPVIVTLPASPSDTKGVLARAGALVQATVHVDSDKLKENISNLIDKVGKIMATAESASAGLTLAEVEAGIEITAEGGVALIGTVGTTASLKLTFKRKV